jgi:hypothetical protein
MRYSSFAVITKHKPQAHYGENKAAISVRQQTSVSFSTFAALFINLVLDTEGFLSVQLDMVSSKPVNFCLKLRQNLPS